MKKQYARNVETVEKKRESYTLENKGLLSKPQKYKMKKDSNTIFVSIQVQDSIAIFCCIKKFLMFKNINKFKEENLNENKK